MLCKKPVPEQYPELNARFLKGCCAFTDEKLDGGFYKSEQSSSAKNGSALVVLYAGDLEKTLETVVASGGTIVRSIFDFPGGRRFHFADPNGNELAIWSDK